MELYLIDSIRYGDKDNVDKLYILMNDKEELGIWGKNFSRDTNFGDSNLCGKNKNDVIVYETLK